jgi:protein involved in polysaccharide export with SLBB domain
VPGAWIEIVVSGAVERGGRLRLTPGATLRTALEAAGGLAWRPGARPEGGVVLRRRAASARRVEVRRWNLLEDPPRAWQSTRLEDRDVIVFAWSLETEGDA